MRTLRLTLSPGKSATSRTSLAHGARQASSRLVLSACCLALSAWGCTSDEDGKSEDGDSSDDSSSGGDATAANGGDTNTNDAADANPDTGDADTGDTAASLPALPTSCSAPAPAADPGGTCTGSAPTGLTLTAVNNDLNEPVLLTHAPDDHERLFIVERPGRIRIIRDGELLSEPFLDIRDRVESGGSEQGLLGLAFEPGYGTSGRFWINFVESRGAVPYTVIASVNVSSSSPDSADPDSFQELLSVRQPASNHNGGMLAFGHDGCLYAGFGDGGSGNDPWNNAQSLQDHMADGDLQSALLGKMIRLDPYNYPDPAPGNLGGDANPHIWDYGMRNPWRFSFDRITGDLYIGDVGQDDWEEVNVEPRGVGHHNYGWKLMEGLHCRGETGDGGDCPRDGLRLPVAEYLNPSGQNTSRSVLGGYVYRGQNVPQLSGRYLYADYNTLEIWTFVYSGEGSDGAEICDEYELSDQLNPGSQLTSFGEDAAGEVYLLTGSGTVWRIDSE